jgi:catechol 2,3-dioxygenase-like lactoylglutathione lyase family enzyme
MTGGRVAPFIVPSHEVTFAISHIVLNHDIAIPHDGQRLMHVASSISHDEPEEWQQHLTEAGVLLEGRTQWPTGGVSVYFRDPDGHLLEIATPGMWKGY